MKSETEKYDNIISHLRKSKPVLDSTEDIEGEVMRRIMKVHNSRLNLSELGDYLFGWVYITFVRRSLIAVSVFLVLVFVYQQGAILRRIDKLSKQTVIVGKQATVTSPDEVERLLMSFKNTGRKFPSKEVTLTEKQVEELLVSLKELQMKYKNLEDLIEGDPDLKQLIEKKLNETNRVKIKL
jgi:hypothetical protein